MPAFGKTSRLYRSDDFLAVKKQGTSARAGCIVVAFKKGRRRRLGIIASRRAGNAVHRNRIKRIVREFFRQNREAFPVGDSVVIPTAGAMGRTNDELRSHLKRALSSLAAKMSAQPSGGR